MALLGRSKQGSHPSSATGALVVLKPQGDPLAGLFVDLLGVSGLAPALCGRIEPQRLYDIVVGAVPILRNSEVRASDHLAQVHTESYDLAWSIFTSHDVSLALCVVTRHDADYAIQMLAQLVEPFNQLAAANGLHTSMASRGKAEGPVAAALDGSRAVFIDDLARQSRSSQPLASAPVTQPPVAQVQTTSASPAALPTSVTPPPPLLLQSPSVAPKSDSSNRGGPPSSQAKSMGMVAPQPAAPSSRRTVIRPAKVGRALVRGENMQLVASADSPAAETVIDLDCIIRQTGVPPLELDAIALVVDAADHVVSDQHFVFFNNLRTPDGAVQLIPHDADESSREISSSFRLKLNGLSPEVAKVVFALAIFDATDRRQSFADVDRASMRVLNSAGDVEYSRFLMERPGQTESVMLMGEIYRRNDSWKMRAIGQGYASGLAGIASDYGVDV